MNNTEKGIYVLFFLALIYLAFPHVMETYQAYARPWDTSENKTTIDTVGYRMEPMTNAHVAEKQSAFKVWEMFTATEIKDPKLLPGATVQPATPKSIPGTTLQPATPKSIPGTVPEPNKHEMEPAVEKPPETTMADMEKKREVSKDRLDPKIQQSKPFEPPRGVIKSKVQHSQPKPYPQPSHHTKGGAEIWGPKAPELDENQPIPGGGSGRDHRSGVYPNIYGPDISPTPGTGSNSSDNNYVPAAEFPAKPFPTGPEYPSPYLNDFSKILKM